MKGQHLNTYIQATQKINLNMTVAITLQTQEIIWYNYYRHKTTEWEIYYNE